MIEIDLTPYLEQARGFAERREAERVAGGEHWVAGSSAATSEWGWLGEFAVAEYLDVELPYRTIRQERLDHYDVAAVQVRTRTRRFADLGLRLTDCRHCIYIVVVPVRLNVVGLVGGIRASDDRIREQGTTGFVDSSEGPRRIRWIPQKALHELPADPPAAFYDGHDLGWAA